MEFRLICNLIVLQELAEKVQKCLTVIVNAKEKQAEQANKAAQSLLDQLAEEVSVFGQILKATVTLQYSPFLVI